VKRRLRVTAAVAGADTPVVPAATQAYVSAACRSGARITFRECSIDTHGTIADTAVPVVLAFVRSSLSGAAPPSTC
jgi:hypothetical protein